MSTPSTAPTCLAAFTATSGIGAGCAATLESLRGRRSALRPCDFDGVDLPTCIGAVAGVDAQPIPATLRRFDCRNNRLAELALRQDGFLDAVRDAAGRHGRRRVGVFLGTSTSGILETEIAYRRRDRTDGSLPAEFDYAATHNAYSLVEYVRERTGIEGPAAAVSAACASSAKAFAVGRRMLEAGIVDAALVGGVDSLCLTTLYGFHSLQLLAGAPCRPFDVDRDGLSIGEAAAFALLGRAPASLDRDAVLLLGSGETNDGHHMSAPRPDGLGAQRAIQAALADARLGAAEIDYVNLHGTGTASNDLAESGAVVAILGRDVPCSSTKAATGHALGAAGALEAIIGALCLQGSLLPAGLHTRRVDPRLEANYITDNRCAPVRRILSNSFGFGGANCCLLLGVAG
ncbi:MAG TPA: beta-ketoacyl-ACP synthase [Steroidobacteraceae bacterium]|nr:beta-ketoacyl-ACP synthase [Steroidobacteraceae bacterium]